MANPMPIPTTPAFPLPGMKISVGVGASPQGAAFERPIGRREARLMTTLLVARLEVGGIDHLCRIRNLSSTGMMIECSVDLTEGEHVRVELRNLRAIDGRVAWARSGHAGLQFDLPVVIDQVLGTIAEPAGVLPRTPRIVANCPALVWHLGTQSAAGLRDLSQSGCRLLLARPLPRYTEVRISIRGLAPRHARVRWATDGSVGVAFLDMLSFADLSEWQVKRSLRFAADRD